MGAQVWLWKFDSNLELLYSFINLFFFLVNLTEGYVSICIFRIYRDSFEQQSFSLVNFTIILDIELSKSYEKLGIFRVLLIS